MTAKYQLCQIGREPGEQEAAAVEEGRKEDHAGNAEAIAEPAREQRGNDITGRDCAEQGRRDRLRLVQAVQHVEDDERSRCRERSFPRRVREQKPPHLGFLPKDAPALRLKYALTPSKTRP